MKIIITDLTRFKNQDKVCTAGVNKDGIVVRPLPYLSIAECHRLNIHPGGILKSEFVLKGGAAPHVEDAKYGELRFHGACSKKKFRKALEATLYDSMSEGFGVEITRGEKCIPVKTPPERSLITIKVNPNTFNVVQNQFDTSQLKAHFSDGNGVEMSFVSVTDLGFFEYAQQHKDNPVEFSKINRFIHSQEELYLRLGLSRAFEANDGRHGYWIQLNGLYTFPNYLKYIRQYD